MCTPDAQGPTHSALDQETDLGLNGSGSHFNPLPDQLNANKYLSHDGYGEWR